ncbi:MAG: hypothetical protein QOD47_2813, partial [Gemmatimonadaceae bacterium]|nr:hypothetical protein [Gemmatimonadaceae bacterium]
MKILALLVASFAIASAGATPAHLPSNAGTVGSSPPSCSSHPAPTENIAAQLAKFRPVQMPFSTTGLSSREVSLVGKLVEAGRNFESIYWRQSDPEGLALYKALANCPGPAEQQIHHYLLINGSSYDLLEGNKPFLAGTVYEPGHSLYPAGITRKEIEDYVAAHPAKKAEIYNPWTVVKRSGKDLVGVPYHVEYKEFVVPAAKALRDAAALSDDKAFANFLRLRADALLTDDYYKSDLAWVDLDNPKFDVIMAPYETYLDDLLGVKTSYGAAVMIRNPGESAKLATYKKYVSDIQEALPLAAADKPSNAGHPTPMEVMDAPYRSGDLRHGYQAVADNLPNDPRIHAEKGTKKIFFKNFMDARVNYVVLPIGKLLMRQDQANLASMDGYLSVVVMHEISHGLGPAYSRVGGKQADIRESIGQIYSGLEEAIADIVGLYGLDWLMNKGVLPKSRARDYYASHVAGIFRTVRFGV